MGVLTMTARVHDLMYQKSNIQFQLLQITRKIRNLTEYSAFVTSGDQSLANMMSLPGSTLGRTLWYMNYSQNYANNYLNQNLAGAQQMYAQNQGGQLSQEQAAYIRQQMYSQAMEKAQQVEQRRLKIEEDRLNEDKERLQTQEQEIEAELKEAREAVKSGIQDMAPKYVAGQ